MLRVIEPVQNSSTYVFDNAFELNGVALVTEICTALVASICGEKGAIDGENLIRKESQKVCNLHQNMKDIVVKRLSQALLKIGKGGFTGYIGIVDTGIHSKMLSPIPVMEDFQKGFHVGVFFEITEELG